MVVKTTTGEPIFVLLGRDIAAPATIRAWTELRILSGKNKRDDPQKRKAESVGLSRQRRWQMRMAGLGRCTLCGGELRTYCQFCDSCHEKRMLRQRVKLGVNKWVKGGKGRPPYCSR